MKENLIRKLLDFLYKLDEAKISYSLEHNIEDAIGVRIVVPGERWEVDFFADGQVYVERFTNSSGEIKDEKELEELFRLFSD